MAGKSSQRSEPMVSARLVPWKRSPHPTARGRDGFGRPSRGPFGGSRAKRSWSISENFSSRRRRVPVSRNLIDVGSGQNGTRTTMRSYGRLPFSVLWGTFAGISIGNLGWNHW